MRECSMLAFLQAENDGTETTNMALQQVQVFPEISGHEKLPC